MTKTNQIVQNSQLEELTADALAVVAGGRFMNIYSKDGFYSGSNVNSFNRRKLRKKR